MAPGGSWPSGGGREERWRLSPPPPPRRVSTPHYRSGLLIEKNDAYTKVFSRAGLTLMWNREDALMVGAAGHRVAPGGLVVPMEEPSGLAAGSGCRTPPGGDPQ